jgi:TusA-related sulfurtransferase
MSVVKGTVDLTMYGCPMHYIKAKEALNDLASGETLLFLVNAGDAVEEVQGSLLQDGHDCEVQSTSGLATTLKVSKRA